MGGCGELLLGLPPLCSERFGDSKKLLSPPSITGHRGTRWGWRAPAGAKPASAVRGGRREEKCWEDTKNTPGGATAKG